MHSPERSPKYKDEQQSMTSSEITVDSGLPTDRQSGNSSPIFDNSGEGHVITIPMINGMGLCIIGGTNRPEGPHIYVEDIIEGSDAHKVQYYIHKVPLITCMPSHSLALGRGDAMWD